MRRRFLAVSAFSALLAASFAANAADVKMPAKAPAMPMPPPFSWSGFYIGGNLGGAWTNIDATDAFFGQNFGNNSNNGGVFIGGGQLGFNYQVGNYTGGNFVWGVEWDFDGTSKNNNNTGNGAIIAGALGLGHAFTAGFNERWVTTIAARFGWAYDRVLFYGKAGGGWLGISSFTVTDLTTGASISGSGNASVGGWLVGAGFEWAFADNWSARFEYDFLGLGNRTFTVPAGFPLAGDTFTTSNLNVQMATVGINYRFNWGATGSMVAARY
jgi:outer membrane immunogenic protein